MADEVVEDKEKSQGRFLTNAGLQGIIASGFAGLAGGLANVATSSYSKVAGYKAPLFRATFESKNSPNKRGA